ncbi:MAG: FAD:protein FMN transferase, partial [Candidatus Omnitrophica bacterium]|nr:FAD:protein FMN transferase [Candidatus Omnitrophota bacterium]
MGKKLIITIAISAAIIFVILLSTSLLLYRPLQSSREIRFALGTICELEIVGSEQIRAQELIDRGFEMIDRYESQLSIYDDDSEINRVNKYASMMAVPVSRTTFDVI